MGNLFLKYSSNGLNNNNGFVMIYSNEYLNNKEVMDHNDSKGYM